MSIGRLGAGPLRGISALLLLGAVAAASLLAVLHALGVERAADDLVADTGKVLHTAAAHEHDRVLLEVVTHARDVSGDLDAARQAHAGDLAEGGVRLLRGGGVDAGAHTASLGRTLEGRRLVLRHLVLAALADQLLNGGHLGGSPSCPLVRTRRSAGHGDAAWSCVPVVSAGAARGRILGDLRSRAISEHAQRSGCPRHEERDYSVAEQRSKRYGRPRGGAPGPARRPGRRAS